MSHLSSFQRFYFVLNLRFEHGLVFDLQCLCNGASSIHVYVLRYIWTGMFVVDMKCS